MQPQQQTTASTSTSSQFKPKRRINGLTWVLIAIAILFVIGALVSMLKKQQPPERPRRQIIANRPSLGVNDFSNTENGVSFDAVDPPGGPADKAGLLGGDVIISFDGQSVKTRDEMSQLLERTPIGKTIEVTYQRDGTLQKTQLTIISGEQRNELADAFDERESGQAQLGFDDHRAKRVPVPATSIYGVQLNDLSSSGPARLAGMEEGDIVIEFDGTPIRTVLELAMRVRRAVPYSTVKVVVMRGTERITIPVKMGRRG